MFNWSGLRGRVRDLRAFWPKRMCFPPVPPSHPLSREWLGEVGPSWRSQELGLPVLLSQTHPGTTWGCAFRREGVLTLLPASLISLGKFTVNIFPGTLSSFLTEPECMPNCEIEPEQQVVRNLFLLKSVRFREKQKQKQKTSGGKPGAGPGRPLVVRARPPF